MVSHSARAGRDAPERSFQMDTFSAPMGEFTIGTSAERFLAIVIGSFSLYSNRSPNSRAAAAEGRVGRPGPMPPPYPLPTPLPLPDPARPEPPPSGPTQGGQAGQTEGGQAEKPEPKAEKPQR